MSRWCTGLSFPLSLVAVVLAACVLLLELREPPPPAQGLPDVIEQRVAVAVAATETRAKVERARLGGQAPSDEAIEARLATLAVDQREALHLEALGRVARQRARFAPRIRSTETILARLEERMDALRAWQGGLEEELHRLRDDRPTPPAMPKPGPSPAEPEAKPAPAPAPAPVPAPSLEALLGLAGAERTKALREILRTHKDFYARLGAATALGEAQAADAVPDLIEALTDRDDLVRTAASEALHRITGQDFRFVHGLTKNERIRIRKRWRGWWEDHEAEVRTRLDQPANAK